MAGLILVNGNIERETDFISEHRELILARRHSDPTVAESRKMLLVTAAWGEREFHEGHVKSALGAIGLGPQFDSAGYDVSRQNLSLWHETQTLLDAIPSARAHWEARLRITQAVRSFYLDETRDALTRFRRAFSLAKELSPGLRMADILEFAGQEPLPSNDENSLLRAFLTDELAKELRRLRDSDTRMLDTLARADQHFERASGVRFHPLWRSARARLENRILSAAGIFLFGGEPQYLLDGIHLFGLTEVFTEAIRRGAGLYTVSAGSLVLCERIIVYHQHEGAEFELMGRGMGLVRGIQLFPHCMERVQTDDRDNLAYLAARFADRRCAGLNEGSYLLLEQGLRGLLIARSVGRRDGVYLFGRKGDKQRYNHGEVLPIQS